MSDKTTFEDRAAFWKYHSAEISFLMVCDVCDYIAANKITKIHPIHDPLVISVHAMYGKPFKNRHPLKLSPDIVPQTLKWVHDGLLDFRDQNHVHTDLNGPMTVEGYLMNELAAFTANGSTKFGISILTPQFSLVRDLCNQLAFQMNRLAKDVWEKNMANAQVPEGKAIINLAREDGPFLVPSKLG
jgi:hypothetical protein